MIIKFAVAGEPVPQGSMTAMPIFKGKGPDRKFLRANVVPNNQKKLAVWRDAVAAEATRVMAGRELLDEPVMVLCEFYRPAPANKGKAKWDSTGPDIDKLERAVLDGITKTIVVNDARVVRLLGEKQLLDPGLPAHAVITVTTMNQETRP